MTTIALYEANRQLREQPLWTLLAADHGPAVLALFESLLLSQERMLTASVFAERLGNALKRLSLEGLDIESSPERLMSTWVAAGYLRRRPASGGEEEYELSLEAEKAVRFLQGLRAPRAVVTESRLAIVAGQLIELDMQTRDSAESRLMALFEDRRKLEEEIASVESGHWTPLAPERALESVRNILGLADELVADFRRVRQEFEELDLRLREHIIETDGLRGDVLDELFRGVDMIDSSDAGRTFKAFYDLLVDHARSTALDAAVAELQKREFIALLTREERDRLRTLRRQLQRGADTVKDVKQNLSRSLSEFVRSPEYRELRVLNRAIKEALRTAMEIRESIRPQDTIDVPLFFTSSAISSISQYRLYNREMAFTGGTMQEAPPPNVRVDLADRFARGDVDFSQLRRDIADVLSTRREATIAEVLAVHPPWQALGSILGLISIAKHEGIVLEDQEELVEWAGLDGVRRCARIPLAYFIKEES